MGPVALENAASFEVIIPEWAFGEYDFGHITVNGEPADSALQALKVSPGYITVFWWEWLRRRTGKPVRVIKGTALKDL